MKRKVCVVTGTRAEYGLLRRVMEGVRASSRLELQVIVTGAHLSPRFGDTYREIEADGFHIDRKVEIPLDSDSPSGLARAMGAALAGCGAALEELEPDLMVALGDRYETFSAVAAALVARVPVAHIHGGEVSEGAFDEALRHSITKMSHLHFVAAQEYARRVIQLGEDPKRVFVVGGLGVDAIRHVKLLERTPLEESLGFKFARRNLLVTFHPATLERATAAAQMSELLAALDAREDTNLIFTMPNADTDNQVVSDMIEKFVATRGNARAYTSLGQQRYLSCIAQVDGVVGNSSSGLTEVPSFRKGTVNIGDRQRGRLKAASVIDAAPEGASISAAIDRLYSAEFQASLASVRNPYGDGGAAEKIVATIETHDLDGLLKKSFHDIRG